MKRAIIILYDGTEANPGILAKLIADLHEYGFISDPDSKPSAYTLDENDIAQAIAGKVLTKLDITNPMGNRYEAALAIVCKPFMSYIKEGELETFAIELTTTLQYNMGNKVNTEFVDAVKTIAEEGSEVNISPTFLFNHGLSNRVIQIIRRTRDVVCQGRHIIIQ
jgi:hypothetical protein